MPPSPSRPLATTKEAAVETDMFPEFPFETHRDAGFTQGISLTPKLQREYNGDLRFPELLDRPYTFANFVMGADGIVSFQLPGKASGGEVSMFNPHDQLLMGILRAAADAVMVGAGTLRAEPHHLWIPGFIYPKAASEWQAYRQKLGKKPMPFNMFVTASGNVDPSSAVFQRADIPSVVFTPQAGGAALRERLQPLWNRSQCNQVGIDIVGEGDVDLVEMMRKLRTTYGVQHLLVEGGPQLMGDLVAAGLMDEVFITDAPQVIGTDGKRPTWAKGHPFTPESAPKLELLSLKEGYGGYVFRRYRFVNAKK